MKVSPLSRIVPILLVTLLATLLVTVLPSPRAHALDGADPAGRIAVTVSILPQAWFAERIGAGEVAVTVLVGPGQSPATFDPGPRRMAALGEADLFVYAGVPFERALLPRVARLPGGPRLVGSVGLPDADEGSDGHAREHDHGHAHGHDHGDLDPHTWLDPGQAAALADTLCAALCHLRPDKAEDFATRRDALRAELAELDAEIAALLAPHRGREIYVFHPAFGHFATAYGLVQISIEEGGREPGARHLATVIERAKQAGCGAIIVQPQFSRKSARTVARSLGVEVVALDPLAEDYAANLRAMARELGRILSAAPVGADGGGS